MTDIKVCEDKTGTVASDITVCDENQTPKPDDIKVCVDDGRLPPDLCIDPSAISLSGSDAPSNGSTYTASGGVAPYSFSLSYQCGSATTAQSGGVLTITTVDTAGGAGSVQVTDSCGQVAIIEVRWPTGSWGGSGSWNLGGTCSNQNSCSAVACAPIYSGLYRYGNINLKAVTAGCFCRYTGDTGPISCEGMLSIILAAGCCVSFYNSWIGAGSDVFATAGTINKWSCP